jgi:Tol biopolymer transport system component
LRSTIVFSSTRDRPSGVLGTNDTAEIFNAGEIYLADPDGNNPRRLTNNDSLDVFAAISPDGRWIVFDRNAVRTVGQTSGFVAPDLFLMNADGKAQQFLTTGSSATWSPDGRRIAFHASASGRGTPINGQPGAATYDSDIFVANVGDLLDRGPGHRTNITNSPGLIDSDADWSPDGTQIAFTIQPVSVTDPTKAGGPPKLYIMNADGTGSRQLLLDNPGRSEVGPDWSPDGKHIAFTSRMPGAPSLEICVTTPDGSQPLQLTDVSPDPAVGPTAAGPIWSPDGTQILFQREGNGTGQTLWVMNADGTHQTQLTTIKHDGRNGYASWGLLRVASP